MRFRPRLSSSVGSSALAAVMLAAALGLASPLAGGIPDAQASTPSDSGGAAQSVTEKDVEFVDANIDSSYTRTGPTSEQQAEEQQVDAVTAPEEEGEDGLDAHIARVDFDSDVVGVAVTWDLAELEPHSVDLRYLEDGVWSEWVELETEPLPSRDGTADPTRAGSEPYLIANGQAAEVVARTAEGTSLPGLQVTVLDAQDASAAENALADVAEVEAETTESEDTDRGEEPAAPQGPVEEPQDSFEETPSPEESAPSVVDKGLTQDVLLDMDGATPAEQTSFGFGATATSGSLNAAGTVYDTGFQGLKITTRKGWQANESWMKWTPKSIKLKGAVVHHTQGNNNYTKAQAADQVRIVYSYHARTLGWGDIGYNLIVDKYGGVWEGRAGGLTKGTQGAQALGANAETFGISILGDFRTSPPPAVARQAMSKAIAWKLNLHGISNPSASIQVPGYYNVVNGRPGSITVPTVSGHRDIGATDCPGNAFYAQMGTVRTEVNNYLKAGGTTSKPAPSSGFNAANVISDAVFYNPGTMTEAQIKTFIETEGKNCKPGNGTTCLKDTKFPTQNLTTLRGGCKPLNMSRNQAPWTIVHKTAQACELNPQVILATLQKEQSGLTQPRNSATWAKAMGSGCPDGSGCDPKQGGFMKQVYYGADKLVSYKLQSQAGHVDAFKAGRTMSVRHNSDASCGSETLKFANVATASLYEYTPYIGNSSKAGCGTTGQKMFWDLMQRYFKGGASEDGSGQGGSIPQPAAVVSKVKPTSIAGADRYATNYELNRQHMKTGKPVFVVTGQDFPDALTVGPAAGMLDGSIVLTRPTVVPSDSLKLLTQKKPSAVYVVGGTGAVSESVVQQLKSATGKTPVRIGGKDRYATSENVLTTFFKDRSFGAPFVASGADYPDALSASAAGGALARPVVLVPGQGSDGKLSVDTASAFKSRGVKSVVIVGGTGVVSGNVEKNISGQGFTTERKSGKDRYLTSQAVNDYVDSQVPQAAVTGLWLTSGRTFPDALSAAAVAGASSERLVLTNGRCVAKPTITDRVNSSGSKVSKVTTVGGKGVLPGFQGQVRECS